MRSRKVAARLRLPALRQIARAIPQDVRQLLGRQPAPEPSLRLFFGSRDELMTETLVQAGTTLLSSLGSLRLRITHDDEGSGSGAQP